MRRAKGLVSAENHWGARRGHFGLVDITFRGQGGIGGILVGCNISVQHFFLLMRCTLGNFVFAIHVAAAHWINFNHLFLCLYPVSNSFWLLNLFISLKVSDFFQVKNSAVSNFCLQKLDRKKSTSSNFSLSILFFFFLVFSKTIHFCRNVFSEHWVELLLIQNFHLQAPAKCL